MSAESETIYKLKAHELMIKSVTVYRDRAEVKRSLKINLNEGINRLIIENISNRANNDSVIVDGHGDAIIHEIQFEDKPSLPNELTLPRLKDLENERKALMEKRQTIENRKQSAIKRNEIFYQIIAKAGESFVKSLPNDDANHSAISEQSLESISKLVDFHGNNYEETVEKIRKMDLALHDEDEKIAKLTDEIEQAKRSSTRSRNVCILVESKNGGNVDLDVSYQVNSASWYAGYEIRVQNDQNDLKLIYYGQIRQFTGEDWLNTKLILSSAEPTRGACVPRLGTLKAEFYKPPTKYREIMPATFGAADSVESMNSTFAMKRAGFALAAAPPEINYAHAKVDETMLSSMFIIERPVTIPSDSSEHKVTIATLNLHPKMYYQTVPSKSTNVFLTASMINDSASPLLAGQASIYLNNSFIAKTHLKTVSPGEHFSCSLGVDPSIKVEYKPVHTFREQGGIISKVALTMYEHKIVVKNTKTSKILLTIREHVPESTDEKIKVKLYSPELENKTEGSVSIASGGTEPQIGARLDANHNLEWTLNIEPSEERELLVKYSLEHPAGQQITFQENFSQGEIE